MGLTVARPRWRSIVVVLASVAIVSVLCSRIHSIYFATFDSVAWEHADAFERYQMLPALARSNSLVGRPRHEVVQLLGPPDFIAGTYQTDDGLDYVIVTPTYDENEILTGLDIPPPNRSALWSILALPFLSELRRWRFRNVPYCRF